MSVIFRSTSYISSKVLMVRVCSVDPADGHSWHGLSALWILLMVRICSLATADVCLFYGLMDAANDACLLWILLMVRISVLWMLLMAPVDSAGGLHQSGSNADDLCLFCVHC